MKIAVTAQKPGWEELPDSRFGRAPWFILVDAEKKTWEAVENLQNRQAAQGAGIQAAATIIDREAQVLISGNVGPKAFRVLQAGGVRIYRHDAARHRTVAAAVAAWERGELEEITAATVEGHSI